MSRKVCKLGVALAAVVATASACGGGGSGTPPGCCCTSVETAGTARIVSVEAAPTDPAVYRCSAADPVVVKFDFTPADAAQSARVATGVSLTVGDGALPPRAWVESSGLTVGSEHAATRLDTAGPCTPMEVSLKDVDYAAGARACVAAASLSDTAASSAR